jgi:ribosomal protein S18 acetylase RimI-like enzyme
MDNPAETLRLVMQYRDFLRRDGKLWGELYTRYVRRKVEDGTFLGLLWSGPGEEAVALVGWELAGGLGRRAFVYLAEGYQRRAVLEELLHRLDSNLLGGPPFVSWNDDVTGIPEPDRAALFAARGFTSVVRADMCLPKGIDPPRFGPDPAHVARTLSLGDEPKIADLLYRTYLNSPERALFATSLDQREDARQGTHEILHGNVGQWLSDASFGIEIGGRLIAQTLANDLEGGLITEVGVDPGYRRQGLARQLMPLTIDALRSHGFEVPRLVVTLWNERAVRLYQSLGFEFVPGGAGRVWLDLKTLGVAGAEPLDA